MARSSIPTYTTGDLVTAAHANTYWRDNEAAHWAEIQALDTAISGAKLIPSGRLTLETGVPVSSTDQTAKDTLYYTPYVGNIIHLYYNSVWTSHTFAELSLDISGYTDAKNYDIFVYSDSGTAKLEGLIWTNDTTRATALAYQDGILVKSGAETRRYIGTIRCSASGKTADADQYRYVYNFYNRVRRVCQIGSLTQAASGYAYFVIGSPYGSATNCGMGGFYRASGTNYADSYFYSSLIPSTPPGHFEVGFRHYSSGNDLAIWVGGGEMIHFPTGYSYIEMKPAVSGGTYSNGTIYADIEM